MPRAACPTCRDDPHRHLRRPAGAAPRENADQGRSRTDDGGAAAVLLPANRDGTNRPRPPVRRPGPSLPAWPRRCPRSWTWSRPSATRARRDHRGDSTQPVYMPRTCITTTTGPAAGSTRQPANGALGFGPGAAVGAAIGRPRRAGGLPDRRRRPSVQPGRTAHRAGREAADTPSSSGTTAASARSRISMRQAKVPVILGCDPLAAGHEAFRHGLRPALRQRAPGPGRAAEMLATPFDGPRLLEGSGRSDGARAAQEGKTAPTRAAAKTKAKRRPKAPAIRPKSGGPKK